ncbi:ABC transporter family protein [Rhodobacter viridis]|uniref:ABC transporter family protein n=1 Tax=Rhodobacter viridis TaxID=1054202 RepID=A0A318TR61_9RHOB|nr:ATP-binding cassette domain-containing protein [Rhodobacter viridis]PYF06427.1 ABC transporter family protein [Rhodobacter viridis]
MNISVDKIRFGDPDALHEYMRQEKDGSRVLFNSFTSPPKANISQLENGSKFFIVGPKGSGKTTILLHLRHIIGEENSALILFKSKIRSEDRSKLDKMTRTIVVEDQGKFAVETDYRTVWEWFILKNVFRLIKPSDVRDGKDYFQDVSLLLQADQRKFNTLFDSMKIEGAKGKVSLSINVGALKSEIGAEIEARRKDDGGNSVDLLDLVRLSQEALKSIKLKDGVKVRLYIDELEFFLEEMGSGERDRRMVRDLIFSAYSMNQTFHESGIDALCYASIRSEVIHSFPGSSNELNKIMKSFSVNLNWEPAPGQSSSILEIFRKKIENSEIEEGEIPTPDPWSSYFPAAVKDKEFQRFLLDMGSHRPRGVLLCLLAAADRAWGKTAFSEDDFDDNDNSFAQAMLDEFKDELSANLFDYEIDAAISILRGKHYIFDLEIFTGRINEAASTIDTVRRLKNSRRPEFVVSALYRAGVIGNFFKAEGSGLQRQTWAARGYPDPILDKPFIVHQSIQRLLDMV